jgi:alpha-beta hydrolase superfamily lysophospholipase
LGRFVTSHIEGTNEFTIAAADGVPLFVRDWPLPPQTKSAGSVLIMHGLGEHCGRYAHVARFFNHLGFSVRTYDHRGHGKSGGPRGDVPNGESMLRDAKLVLDDFSRQLTVPPLLLGHSMGGLFAAQFATANMAPLRGLILSSPALALYMSGLQRGMLTVATALIPGVGVSNGLKTRYLSHDQEVVQAYENDALVHPKISARLLNCMLSAIDFAQARAGQLAIPTLMLVAEDDRLVDPAGSRRFSAALPTGSAQIHFYPGFYHELFNETEAEQVFGDLRTWLQQLPMPQQQRMQA